MKKYLLPYSNYSGTEERMFLRLILGGDGNWAGIVWKVQNVWYNTNIINSFKTKEEAMNDLDKALVADGYEIISAEKLLILL